MQWYERFGIALTALQEAGTAALDLVTSNGDEDESVVSDLVHIVTGVATAGFQAAVAAPAHAALDVLGTVGEASSEVITRVPRWGQTAVNLANSPTWQRQSRYDTWGEALTNWDTWQRAWTEAGHTSLGQSLDFGGTTLWTPYIFHGITPGRAIDILDPEQVKRAKDDALFNVVTGVQDGIVAWYADPISIAGKGVKAAKIVSKEFGAGSSPTDPWLQQQLFKHTPLGRKGADPYEFAMNSEAVDRSLAWMQGRSPREIQQLPFIKAMPNKDNAAGVFAGLIDREDTHTAKLVIAAGIGSQRAMDELRRAGDDIAWRIDSFRGADNLTLEAEFRRRDAAGLFGDEFHQYYKDQISGLDPKRKDYNTRLAGLLTAMETQDKHIYDAVLGSSAGDHGLRYEMGAHIPRKGDAKRADKNVAYANNNWTEYYQHTSLSKASEKIHLPKAFGTPMRFVTGFPFKIAQSFTNKMPPTWIDPHRGDSSGGLVSYMKHATVYDQADVNRHLNAYLSAPTIQAKQAVVEGVESEALERLAAKYDIAPKYAEQIIAGAKNARNNVITQLKHGRAGVYGIDMDDGSKLRWAALETQQVNAFPLLDLKEYERTMAHNRTLLKVAGVSWHSGRQAADDVFNAFNGLWSAAQLLRVGYMVRNLTDDSLRILATMGPMAMVQMIEAGVQSGIGANVATHFHNVLERFGAAKDVMGAAMRGTVIADKAAYRNTVIPVRPKSVRRTEARSEIRARIDQMGRDLGSATTQSSLGFTYKGVYYPAPYGGSGDIYNKLVASNWDNLGNMRDGLLNGLRNFYPQWDKIDPDQAHHLESWTHVIHNQIGKSELAQQFLAGSDASAVKMWLMKDRVGQAVLAKIRGKKVKHVKDAEVDQIVGDAQALIDMMVPILPGHAAGPLYLRSLAAERKVTPEILERLFPDQALRPQVFGPMIDIGLSQGIHGIVEGIVNAGFKMVAAMPSDKLIRHPVYRSMYIKQMQKNHEMLAREVNPKDFTNDDIETMAHHAREAALKQLNGLLYDGSNKSNIAYKFRMLTGFMSAWQDSLGKWGKIILDDPSVMVRGGNIWNAPNEMNLGSTIDPNRPVGQQRVPRIQVVREDRDPKSKTYGQMIPAKVSWDPFTMNDDSVIEAYLPKWAADFIPGAESQGSTRISKASMNLVLQGESWWLPGASALTSIAASQAAINFPTNLQEVYKWAIPYGPESNVLKSLAPAWVQRLMAEGTNVTDGAYYTAMTHIFQTETQRARLHKRDGIEVMGKVKFWKEIKDRTDKYFKLRSLVGFFSPVPFQMNSPYQFYIDKLHEMRQQDFEHADERFLETYGDDFYMFTVSVSKNNTGLPASKQAYDLSKRNKDLIAKNPELARILIPDMTDTDFNQYVYEAQFAQKIAPGSDLTVRERRDPQEAIEQNAIQLGWTKYTQAMDYLDGLELDPSMDPEFLDFFRKFMGKTLAKAYPEFGRDFYKTDGEKLPARINEFTELIGDPKLQSRPEIRQLSMYLIEREKYLSILDEKKAANLPHTLKAKENRSLALDWKAAQLRLAEGDTKFGRIFWRFLSNDRLQRSALEVE